MNVQAPSHPRPLPVTADAPGRVNLLGEHTDYSEGYVLPTAIPQRTRVTLRPPSGAEYRVRSASLGQGAAFTLDRLPAEGFARYLYGCLHEARAAGGVLPYFDIEIESEVPIGAGLSSSAALEVAMLRALRAALGAPWDDVAIARMAQRAEVEHAGVRCGILDQMASSLADTGSALFIDTRTLERRRLPLPPGSAVLVLDSGVTRALAESGYNQRRSECEEAARLLGVAALRDVGAADDPPAAGRTEAAIERLPEPLRRRARHVVSENGRVLEALACDGDARRFGLLMNRSHASLRDDFEVSVEPLDRLVAMLQAHPAVFGAKLTGAGFGGATVALCRSGELREVAQETLAGYARGGGSGRMLVPATERA